MALLKTKHLLFKDLELKKRKNMPRKMSNVFKISYRFSNEIQYCFIQFCTILLLAISTIVVYAKTFSENI